MKANTTPMSRADTIATLAVAVADYPKLYSDLSSNVVQKVDSSKPGMDFVTLFAAWLKSKKLSKGIATTPITAAEFAAAFDEASKSHLGAWRGAYVTNRTGKDGSPEILNIAAGPKPSNTVVVLDGEMILMGDFVDGVLTWGADGGNKTAGEIVFSKMKLGIGPVSDVDFTDGPLFQAELEPELTKFAGKIWDTVETMPTTDNVIGESALANISALSGVYKTKAGSTNDVISQGTASPTSMNPGPSFKITGGSVPLVATVADPLGGATVSLVFRGKEFPMDPAGLRYWNGTLTWISGVLPYAMSGRAYFTSYAHPLGYAGPAISGVLMALNSEQTDTRNLAFAGTRQDFSPKMTSPAYTSDFSDLNQLHELESFMISPSGPLVGGFIGIAGRRLLLRVAISVGIDQYLKSSIKGPLADGVTKLFGQTVDTTTSVLHTSKYLFIAGGAAAVVGLIVGVFGKSGKNQQQVEAAEEHQNAIQEANGAPELNDTSTFVNREDGNGNNVTVGGDDVGEHPVAPIGVTMAGRPRVVNDSDTVVTAPDSSMTPVLDPRTGSAVDVGGVALSETTLGGVRTRLAVDIGAMVTTDNEGGEHVNPEEEFER